MSETTARPPAAQLGIPHQTPPLAEGRAEAEQLTGTPATWELKKNRGSTTVWEVTGPTGHWALKIGRSADAAVVARETQVLRHIATVSPTSYGARSKSGRTPDSAWQLTPWLTGPSTWEAFRSVRDGTMDRSQALAAAVDLAAAVGALHQTGWVHGDVQPHHAIHAQGGVRLIGCSWAWHPNLPPSYASHSGLLHLMSPELIHRVESEERPIAPTQPDETYALAAGLWWAATNAWPLDYTHLGIDPATFTAKGLRGVLVRRWPPLGRISTWPQLDEVLRSVLTARPSERPTALNLAQWLRSLPS
ncbi:phosphotransferase family enzyme [Streptomyces sp. KhCrAH-43]|uniref:phosphotransferase n=1 Tax=unclassified Streptomyces TaxID=2593676 RepID=UPI0003794A40|nr:MULTISPECIES: phosphotransferase [unclassified Streptomyces]MYS32912.1 phosphotransferase [Streptomyces sp. SID4920]MYX64297.1 phosphotransferase [Streptomyces sp. SID8373]RAJ47872.1 phosphotransferase family enzyme [Streptomyces sp. KhCrAH-43]